MSIGPSTSALLETTGRTRRQDVTASYVALAQACAATGDDARHAELVSDHPHDVWSLPASRAIALVHTGQDEAWALVRGAELLEQHRVAVVAPYYGGVRTAAGRAVTFWHDPGERRRDESLSARVTAAVHRIHPGSALWLEEHDPFAGLLDGLDDAPLSGSARRFLFECTAWLRAEWAGIDWPTPPTVILGARRLARCHDGGTHPQLALRRPLWRGHREWDLVAARWSNELLRGRRDDLQAYHRTYTAHGRTDAAMPCDRIGAWSGYQVVRDLVVLTVVMDTVRRARLDSRTHDLAVHQVACLRGARPAPWDWGQR
ncbi:hypothetical protein [Streptomyces sp. NRRL WC-3742]|uniref:hypothetical protein n=1 Tax=Streptomyces sp. NRRL WC-3742 TaxID=1463934 RepID=UPI0004C49234|nr:hypothetical protein [Streptomyces sp. NRRL WC-3742]